MEVSFERVRLLRAGRLVLDIAEAAFTSGRVTALVGPNGAGKTAMLRLIAGLERPAVGEVRLGRSLVRPGRTDPAIAYAFPSPDFIAGSVRQNIELALRLRRIPAQAREERLRAAAAACGIEGLLGRDARRLSGGEAQRTNLARALALRAPVTLLDEPLAGLDAPGRRQLLRDLPRILRSAATTAIVVTHDRDEALRLAEEMVVLVDGRVRAAGSRASLFTSPPDAATAAFLGHVVVSCERGQVAIAPRTLVAGPGDVTFELVVEEVVDLGIRREAIGTIGGAAASVTLPPGFPAGGSRLLVSAPAAAVTRFPGQMDEPP